MIWSQDRRPESLLPPGFNDPQNLPPPEKATPTPRPPRPETARPTPEQGTPSNATVEPNPSALSVNLGNILGLETVSRNETC